MGSRLWTDHHGSDVEGLRGVHLAQLSQGLGPPPSPLALLVLELPVLDQASADWRGKDNDASS